MKVLRQLTEEHKIRLDAKDKKILSALAKNSRDPITHIAKQCMLSRDSVNYRIKNMTDKGLIKGYRITIDAKKLGYDIYHIFIQLNQLTETIEKDIIKKFQAYPFTRSVIKFNGRYDFELALIASDVQQFEEQLYAMIHDCGPYLKKYDVLTVTKTYVANVFPKGFISTEDNRNILASIPAEKVSAKTSEKASEINVIDDTDRKILSIIREDAILPYYSVAEKLKISHDTVRYRIKRMTDSGMIRSFVPVINFSVISYNVYTLLLQINDLSHEKDIKLRTYLETDDNILWAAKCIGRYNVIMYVCAKDIDELHRTIINLRNTFSSNITDYETLIAYESFKYTYTPEILFK